MKLHVAKRTIIVGEMVDVHILYFDPTDMDTDGRAPSGRQ